MSAGTADIEKLVALVRRCERPVVHRRARSLGTRSTNSNRWPACGPFGSRTSAVAKGLFTGCPDTRHRRRLRLTLLGKEPSGRRSSCLFWGARTCGRQGDGALIGDAMTVVQVDDDPDALGARTVRLTWRPRRRGRDREGRAPANSTTTRNAPRGIAPARSGPASRGQSRWNDVATTDISTATTIDPRVLSNRLDASPPADRSVAIDSGNFMGYPSATARAGRDRLLLHSGIPVHRPRAFDCDWCGRCPSRAARGSRVG